MTHILYPLRRRIKGLVQSRIARFLLARRMEEIMQRYPLARFTTVPLGMLGIICGLAVVGALSPNGEVRAQEIPVAIAVAIAVGLAPLWAGEFVLSMRAWRRHKRNAAKVLSALALAASVAGVVGLTSALSLG